MLNKSGTIDLVLKFASRDRQLPSAREDDEIGTGTNDQARRFDVARYYHVTIGRTTGTRKTYQNLANNSDAVGTTVRILHKSWRSLSLGAKLHPFIPELNQHHRQLVCMKILLPIAGEKAFLSLFSLFFLLFVRRDACTHESFKFCSLRVMEHSRHGTPMLPYRPRSLSFFRAIEMRT